MFSVLIWIDSNQLGHLKCQLLIPSSIFGNTRMEKIPAFSIMQ